MRCSVLLKQTFKNTQTKRETTSGIPQITVLLRKSQRVFSQMSYWRKKWGKYLILLPSLHPLGLQKEQVSDFSTEDPLPTKTSLCIQPPPGLLLAFPHPLERSVWEKNKNLTNEIRNQQRATKENKPSNHLEWFAWIIASQAELNLLDVGVFESREAFSTYLKLKWWAVKALTGTGILSA